MNLRSRVPLHHPGIQLAPLVDVLLLLLIFFLLTWNAARNENELDVKVPKAAAAKENTLPLGPVVINVKSKDGSMVVNSSNNERFGSESDLLKGLLQLDKEQSVVIRGDEDRRLQEYYRGLEHLHRSRSHERRLRHGEMNTARSAACFFVATALLLAAQDPATSQNIPRAQPVEESPAPTPPPEASASPIDTLALERRQLDYANALFTRKLYDLAIPEDTKKIFG